MHDVLDPWANPVTYAVPFFLLFIGIELAALKWLDHDTGSPGSTGVTGYMTKDASTSILMGLFSLVSTLILKAAAFFVYIAPYRYVAPWHLGCAHGGRGRWSSSAWTSPTTGSTASCTGSGWAGRRTRRTTRRST